MPLAAAQPRMSKLKRVLESLSYAGSALTFMRLGCSYNSVT
jgi:hypothetical protein